jgi:TonB family protein
MRTHLLCVLGLIGACVSTAGDAAPAPTLQPLKQWVVDYGDTQCTALREFGDAANPIVFGIVPSPDGGTYELLVKRPRSGPDFAEEMPGTVDFGKGPIKAWLLYFGTKKGRSSLYQYRISAEEMVQARSAPAVTLHADGGEDFSFRLAVMPALLDGLKKCTADLQQYWNMYGQTSGKMATPSKGDIRRIFSADDYPSDALRRDQEGLAQYMLLIDEKGSVAACHVMKPSGVPILDAMGCQVIRQRAKFAPAVDANGKPMRSTYVTPPIRWALG